MRTDNSTTSTRLSSLAPNTDYTITICATTSVGCGNITSTVGLTNEDGMCWIAYVWTVIYHSRLFLITAPHEIIQLEVSSSTLASNSSVNVSFIWTQPSSRNGSYKFELQYSAKQIFQVGETRNATSTSQLPGEESIVVLPDGLPYAQYNVTIFAYNIKRGQRYRGQITDVQYLSIPISKLLLMLLVTTLLSLSKLFVCCRANLCQQS